ncbi:Fe(3+)-hydroxamate ABC transporter permease FhuB [Rhizobium sp. S152]|uniref:Fe(3+)-hydroxamate ABC transporter permease FhuB n=1 Tax=Rhizobium sp. S152 TaxID=3055038 RepID=UPI0025A9C591|nr:Fe(3+)-hydroxamate ABC transporter permease FhuB [Rhizobium sp. S152]MDM9625252.1 Fe(3+)-hydroxamate ABC transporter permease FhuB [Rhizobium sp. S152]
MPKFFERLLVLDRNQFATSARVYWLAMILALAFCFLGQLRYVPLDRLVEAFLHPDNTSFGEAYVHFSLLPRMAVAVLAGTALGFTGAIFQQILKNPLAEPSTLGILSGAQLAITIVSLTLAGVSAGQRELAGVVGALAAVVLVCGLSFRSGFAPVTLLLSGMIVSFAAGSASVITALFHHEYLRSVFIWGSGSLIQNDFSNAVALSLRMLMLIPALLLFVRPLAIVGLDDAGARSLGISPSKLRVVVLFLATVLSAMVVARIGVIAFIGLAAPHIARLCGARTLPQRLLWGGLLGGALLLLADGVVLVIPPFIGEVPTGTITALTGALAMLFMLREIPPTPFQATADSALQPMAPITRNLALPLSLVLMMLVAGLSLTEHVFSENIDVSVLAHGRWPRVLTSVSAGAMLALSGAVLQAVARNPMASPEGLGVSGGAGLGIIAALFLGGMSSPVMPLAGGIIGALLALAIILFVARRHSFAPGPVMLAGVAVGALVTSVISVIVASGDPRATYVLAWTMGPTFRATGLVAIIAALIAISALLLSPLFRRWIEILPMGDALARSIGMRPVRIRATLLLFSATLTAAATLIVGPLSFVGLMAPHMARMSRPRGPGSFMLMSSVIGGLLMMLADWIGRSVDFPYEIPAGVLAAFIGCPYFIFLVFRQGLKGE